MILDEAIEDEDQHAKQKKIPKVKSNSLHKLSQREIEDLILLEQTSSSNKVGKNQLELNNNGPHVGSGFSDILAQGWDPQV